MKYSVHHELYTFMCGVGNINPVSFVCLTCDAFNNEAVSVSGESEYNLFFFVHSVLVHFHLHTGCKNIGDCDIIKGWWIGWVDVGMHRESKLLVKSLL